MPKSRNGRIVSAAGGVLGLCVIFACMSSVFSPNTETPSQVAEVEERAAAPVVLDTPTRVEATRTPVPPTDTPIPTPTDTPTLASTDTPVPAPIDTPTKVPTATLVPVSGPSANGNANLRAGPGTGFAVAGSVQPGEKLEVVGRSPAGDWLQLAGGLWIASRLVNDVPDVPVVEVPTAPAAPPTATSAPAAPEPPAPTTFADVQLIVVINASESEILEVRNAGQSSIDISGWELRGSKGDDFCIIPGGTVLQAGEGFQIATGDSQPTARGYKCGNKPIWNNKGETIILKALDGQVKQIVTG